MECSAVRYARHVAFYSWAGSRLREGVSRSRQQSCHCPMSLAWFELITAADLDAERVLGIERLAQPVATSAIKTDARKSRRFMSRQAVVQDRQMTFSRLTWLAQITRVLA